MIKTILKRLWLLLYITSHSIIYFNNIYFNLYFFSFLISYLKGLDFITVFYEFMRLVTWVMNLTDYPNWLEFIFFNWFFLILLFNIFICWELSFIFCFGFIFLRLIRSHDPNHKFEWLIRVDSCYFLILF
jgi:hypothetical protein